MDYGGKDTIIIKIKCSRPMSTRPCKYKGDGGVLKYGTSNRRTINILFFYKLYQHISTVFTENY